MKFDIDKILFITVNNKKAEVTMYGNYYEVSHSEYIDLISTSEFQEYKPYHEGVYNMIHLNKNIKFLYHKVINHYNFPVKNYFGEELYGFYYDDDKYMFIKDNKIGYLWPAYPDVDMVVSHTNTNLKIIEEL